MTDHLKTTEAHRAGIVTTSPVVGTDGAALRLGVSPATLETWRSTKRVKIPFLRVGRRVLYRLADLDAFLESQAALTGGQ